MAISEINSQNKIEKEGKKDDRSGDYICSDNDLNLIGLGVLHRDMKDLSRKID